MRPFLNRSPAMTVMLSNRGVLDVAGRTLRFQQSSPEAEEEPWNLSTRGRRASCNEDPFPTRLAAASP